MPRHQGSTPVAPRPTRTALSQRPFGVCGVGRRTRAARTLSRAARRHARAREPAPLSMERRMSSRDPMSADRRSSAPRRQRHGGESIRRCSPHRRCRLRRPSRAARRLYGGSTNCAASIRDTANKEDTVARPGPLTSTPRPRQARARRFEPMPSPPAPPRPHPHHLQPIPGRHFDSMPSGAQNRAARTARSAAKTTRARSSRCALRTCRSPSRPSCAR